MVAAAQKKADPPPPAPATPATEVGDTVGIMGEGSSGTEIAVRVRMMTGVLTGVGATAAQREPVTAAGKARKITENQTATTESVGAAVQGVQRQITAPVDVRWTSDAHRMLLVAAAADAATAAAAAAVAAAPEAAATVAAVAAGGRFLTVAGIAGAPPNAVNVPHTRFPEAVATAALTVEVLMVATTTVTILSHQPWSRHRFQSPSTAAAFQRWEITAR